MCRLGNHYADVGAKKTSGGEGYLGHPQPSAEDRERLDPDIKMSRAVCQLAAKVLPSWPRLDL
eukprot:1287258-Pyramimonas_sp.AAC.1